MGADSRRPARQVVMAAIRAGCWVGMACLAVRCASPTDPEPSDSDEQAAASIVLSPASTTLATGEPQQFLVAVLDKQGRPVRARVEWQATGGSVSDEGLYTAGSSTGTWAVTATSGNLSASATVRIVQPDDPVRQAASIIVIPESVELGFGEVQLFTAEVRDQFGEVMNVAVTWGATGGTIDATGLYTAGSLPGAYQVSAHTGSLSATASITIDGEPPPPSPPSPGTDVEILGAWGCSQVTHEWQAFDRHPAPFGTWTGIDFGGGALVDWHAALSGQASKAYWGIFQEAADRHPGTTDVYAEICIRAASVIHFSEADLQQMAEEVFQELRSRMGTGVRIWATGMADWEGEVCSVAGPEGAEVAGRMADHVISLGLAERGPLLDPWTKAELEGDRCHPNAQGEDRAAAEIVEFFID